MAASHDGSSTDGYDHTQRAGLYLVLIAVAGICFAGTVFVYEVAAAVWALCAVGAVMLLFGFSFAYLRIRDLGDSLSVRFGPLPIFGTKIPYSSIDAVEACRSAATEGRGIHYTADGWLYNIRGRDCVRILMRDATALRVGTDEPAALRDFLHSKIG